MSLIELGTGLIKRECEVCRGGYLGTQIESDSGHCPDCGGL